MSALDRLVRRASGAYDVDAWGLDADLVDALAPVAALRWSIAVRGAVHLPAVGPALIVLNRRVGLSEPIVASEGVRHETGRRIRFVGVPDVAGVDAVLRRLGGVPGGPDELDAILRDGSVGGVLLDRHLRHRHFAGALDPSWMGPVLRRGVPVVPAIAVGWEVGRRWRVVLGRALEPPARRGPLAEADWADRCRRAVQELLDEQFPPRWPFS